MKGTIRNIPHTIPFANTLSFKIKARTSNTVPNTKNEINAHLNNVESKADDNTANIAVINGNEAQEGSIKKALKDAKDYTDTAVADEKTGGKYKVVSVAAIDIGSNGPKA